jgi:hypothetical protein
VDSVGVRLQAMQLIDQVLVLARMASLRSDNARFSPKDVTRLFDESSLPQPSNISNAFASLEKRRLLTRGRGSGAVWTLTPQGRAKSETLASDIDLAALSAESLSVGTSLGGQPHPVVPPSLAPPSLVQPLRAFLEHHPFERNVFGMTRFPEEGGPNSTGDDPVAPALEVARDACAKHGLEFHLASQRALVDDLWGNVAAHMWASHYGIAFFEDRVARGVNYNLTIEVGAMLMAGRRCALLKDKSIERMPTDLVGHIYRDVDLEKRPAVSRQLHSWLRDDLNLGSCADCPKS